MKNKSDQLLIIAVLVILALTLWFVRCSNSTRVVYSSAETTVELVSDTIPDSLSNKKQKKIKQQKIPRRPKERNYLDEKLTD